MNLTLRLALIVLLAHYFCAGMPNNLESPFGLAFSPTAVVASRFNSSGVIELTRHPLAAEYQVYFQDAVHQYGSPTNFSCDKSSAISMFQKAVAPITERLSKQLGHMPEYTTLFIPSIFDYNVRDAAASAVFGDYFDRAVRPGWTREATCPGFGFLEGKNLGRKPEECVDGGPVNVILVFEYENDYLYAWLMEVEFELQTYPVILKEICKECGESFQEEIDEEAYKKRVNTFLHNFINDQVMRTHQRDSLRAIIISGEATTPAITSLGVMAKQAVGTETVKIMTDIDPPEVVAHGAAVWARLTQQIPQVFMPDAGNGISPLGHDEL